MHPTSEAAQAIIPPMDLPGFLEAPQGAAGVVVFAHGSGSSRLSPRNAAVAAILRDAGLATLLFDLLTPVEARDRANVFDIPLLADRLDAAIRFVLSSRATSGLPLGLFGASTGAAAALLSAAREPDLVSAVVSRGGRPDLTGDMLGEVRAPTLFIVGGDDTHVLALNRSARKLMACETELAVIPGATHLFEEPGAMEEVARLASDWFANHARKPPYA